MSKLHGTEVEDDRVGWIRMSGDNRFYERCHRRLIQFATARNVSRHLRSRQLLLAYSADAQGQIPVAGYAPDNWEFVKRLRPADVAPIGPIGDR